MPLQLRRGTAAELSAITPQPGELIYVTDQTQLFVGDGTTPGGNLVGGFAANDAKDAAAASLLAGTHQNISFTYNSTTKSLSAKVDILVHDTIEADAVDTAAIKDGSTVILDVSGAMLYADVTGDVSGNLTGNVTGDVSGNLTGNVSGNVTGNVITNLISSSDSSAIIVDTPTNFQGPVTVESSLSVADGILMTAENTTVTPLYITTFEESDQSPTIIFRRSRGSATFSTPVQNGDRIQTINFLGNNGTTYSQAAAIQARVFGTPSSGIVPGQLRFLVTAQDGTELESMTMQPTGDVFLYGRTSASSPLQIFTGHDDATNASNVIFTRSRNNINSPTALQSGDPVFDVAFAGHDGTAFRATAQIRVVVDGAVASNQVPGRMEFFTTSSSGVAAARMKLTSQGILQVDTISGNTNSYVSFSQIPVLPTYANEAAADAAIGGSGSRINGMMYYDTSLTKIRAVAGGSWVDIN